MNYFLLCLCNIFYHFILTFTVKCVILYKYNTFRFSDHKHDEAEQNKDVIESYEIVGEKPKDLPDIGWEIFMDYVDEIKAEIRQHEIDVYRFPKTTLEKKL